MCRRNRRKPTRSERLCRAERDRALAALEAIGRQLDLSARIVANIADDLKNHRNTEVPFEAYSDPRARLRGRKALVR
jgi:hypothetical protein